MIKREIIYDDVDGNAIIWCQDNEDAEITCIYEDKEMYYEPDKLLDIVLFTQVMDSMSVGENDRNNIRKYITELWDEFITKK